MKAMHWARITPTAISKTVWVADRLYCAATITLPTSQLEATFCQKQPGSKPAASAREKSPAKATVVNILDAQRKQNIGIVLKALRVDNATIRQGILRMDDAVLSLEQLRKLEAIFPTPEEIEQVMAFDDDLALLSREDRFCRDLGDITQLHQRLHSWIFKLSFEATCDEIIPSILKLSDALYQLLHSERFKALLKLVLLVGNFLNNGPGALQSKLAYGFRLQSLNKLGDVKTVDGTRSLLDFLVEWVATEHPPVLDFPAELSDLPEAVKVSPQLMKQSIAELRRHVTLIQRTLVSYTPCGPLDAYESVMQPFIQQADAGVKIIEKNFQVMGKSMDAVAQAFGEDLALFQPEQFLADINTFILSWNAALARRQDAQKKAARRK